MKRIVFILSSISILAQGIEISPITSTLISGDYRCIVYIDGKIYAATRRGLEIISKKGMRLGALGTPGDAISLTIDKKYAYIADSENGLFIADISNPMRPEKVISYDVGADVKNVAIAKHSYALLACDGKGLKVLDISSPSHLKETGYWEEVKDVISIKIKDNYAYLLGEQSGLHILDIKSPSKPHKIGTLPLPAQGYHLFIEGALLYIACGTAGLIIVDISDPSNPEKKGSYRSKSGTTKDVVVRGDYAYLANDYGGLEIIKIADPANPQQVSHLTMSGAISLDTGDDRCFVATGIEGIKIIDITDLSKLEKIKMYKNQIKVCDVDKDEDIVPVACGRAGLRILDLSKPEYPMTISEFGSSDLRRVIKKEELLYIADYYTGVKVLDCKNPENPQLKYRETYVNRISCFGVSEDFIAVVDDQKNRLWILSKCPTCPTDRLRSMGYKKFSFPILDIVVGDEYLFLAGGDSGVRVVTSPKPEEVGSFVNKEFIQSLAIKEDRLYLGTKEGLHILNITDPVHPREIGKISLSSEVKEIEIGDDLAFLACGKDGIIVINISNPHKLKKTESYNTPGETLSIEASGNLLLVADRYSLEILSLRK